VSLGGEELRLDSADHLGRDLILHGKEVVELAVVPLGPHVGAALRLD
jgi:hypothetical protein